MNVEATENKSNGAIAEEAAPTDLQKTVAGKITKVVIAVVGEIFKTIQQSKLKPKDFVDTYVTPKQAALKEIDERTSKFFQKVICTPVNAMIDMTGLSPFFETLAKNTGVEDIRKQIVEGFAYPKAKELLDELDKMKPTIVDDLIAS